jgi:hypothetical protein
MVRLRIIASARMADELVEDYAERAAEEDRTSMCGPIFLT